MSPLDLPMQQRLEQDAGNRKRIVLGNFPTRLTLITGLGGELGVNLWIKHEFEADGYGAGNKIRKLEYLLPEILSGGFDGLIVDGTTQSNCAMALATYAPQYGLTVDLVLYGDTAAVGNFADIQRSGANLTILPEWSPKEIQKAEKRLLASAARKGRRLYVVPTGATNAVTVHGGIDLATEIAQQEDEIGTRFDCVVFPTASGGTQAGLEIGRVELNRNWTLIGVGVANDAEFFRSVARDLAESVGPSRSTRGAAAKVEARTHMGAVGVRYGIPLPGTFEELRRIRTQFGVVLDSIYTYKTYVGLRQLIENGDIRLGSNVLFIHTGGTNERFIPESDLT